MNKYLVRLTLLSYLICGASAGYSFSLDGADPCNGIEGQWQGMYRYTNSQSRGYVWDASGSGYKFGYTVRLQISITNCRTADGRYCTEGYPTTYFIEGQCNNAMLNVSIFNDMLNGSIFNNEIHMQNYRNEFTLHKMA